MAYLGNTPAARFSSMQYQDLTGGTGTSFTLDHAVGNEQEIEVFVNNVRQEPSVAYTVSGTALTMTGSIVATDVFYVVFQGLAQQTATHPSNQALQATSGTFSGAVSAASATVTGDLTVDTNTLYVDSTNNNVGIGTGSPNMPLHISNSTDGNLVNLYTTGTGGSAAQLKITGASNLIKMTTGGSDALAFETSGSNERMRIDGATGNVGIGVSDPSQVLDLVGSSNTGSGSVRAGGAGSGTQAAFMAQAQFGSASFGTYANYPAVLNSSNSPMVYFNTNASGRAVFAEGITFNGDTAAANALDDYEEGTWVPTYSAGTSGTPTTTSSSGHYRKVGSLVTVSLIISGAPNGASGALYISGLPFTSIVSGGYGTGHAAIYGQTWSWAAQPASSYVGDNTSNIYLWDVATGNQLVSDMSAGGNNLETSFTYITNS